LRLPDQPTSPLKVAIPATGANSAEQWKARAQASRDQIDRLKPDWDKNQERYLAKSKAGAAKDEVVVPKDYANTEQKKGQLFFETPHIQCLPLEPVAGGLEDAVTVFEAVINHYVGPDGVNAKATVDEVLTDALCPSGIFAAKIAYESVVDGTKPVQVGMMPDPNWQPPAPQASQLGMGMPPMPPPQPPMVPQMVDAPNIISERYLWERITPAKLLIPVEFTGSDYDKASWLGFDFLIDEESAKRAYNLPLDFKAFVGEDDRLIGHAKAPQDGRGQTKRVKGSEIWYKASLFDETVKNPELIRVLVLIDGMQEPVKHQDSPYQQIQPDGAITGMPGFPVHVGALRYVSDSAFPPSDCQMSKAPVEELSSGRTDMIRQRKRSIPMRFADLGRIGGDEGLAKIEKNILNGIIPLESAQASDPPIFEAIRAAFPRENFTFDQIANRDISEIWAMDSAQRGLAQDHAITATEVERTQQNANIRLRKERTKFLEWFARGVTKLASLIQQFADQEAYVAIVGPDGVRRLQAWDKTKIQGRFLFQCKPDSGVYIDANAASSKALNEYNLLHQSPFINQQELLADTLRAMNRDPAKLIQPPQQKPTEVPKISFTFNDQSLNPQNPAFPIVMEILRQGGIPVDDRAIGAAQRLASLSGQTASAVPHGQVEAPPPARTFGNAGTGGASGEPLNKHAAERTGERSGPPIGGLAGAA
jgi:hypothetical protein